MKLPELRRIVAKFLVDRLLNNMDLAFVLENIVEGSQNAEELFDDEFPELGGSWPSNLSEAPLRRFIKKRNVPENYCDLDFSERSDRFHG